MSLWIPVSLAAAVFQTLRFMLQRTLSRGRLNASGATFARFAYSAPLMALGLTAYLSLSGRGLPDLTGRFWAFALAGGAAQIIATVCLVALFAQRNFAVGVTFSKTEVILTALAGLVVLGDRISAPALAAIVLGVFGVLLLSGSAVPGSTSGAAFWRGLGNRATGLGLAAGALFAVSAVGYRGASLALGAHPAVFRAAVTLAVVTLCQMAAMAVWLAWRDRAQLAAVWAARRQAVWIGLTSLAGSFGWFWAFSLQNAAYVKAVGQVELILSLIVSVTVFRETVTRRELAGMAALTLSILGLILTLA